VSAVAAITFNSITSISKIIFANLGAKGLRLHKDPRTWSRSSRSEIITKKKKTKTDQSYLSKNSKKLHAKNQKNLDQDKLL
jgi:hypothetical protein